MHLNNISHKYIRLLAFMGRQAAERGTVVATAADMAQAIFDRITSGEADVTGIPGIHIECKRVEKLNLEAAMEQAVRDARSSERPAVFHRKNRKPWLTTMLSEDFIAIYKDHLAYIDLVADEQDIKE